MTRRPPRSFAGFLAVATLLGGCGGSALEPPASRPATDVADVEEVATDTDDTAVDSEVEVTTDVPTEVIEVVEEVTPDVTDTMPDEVDDEVVDEVVEEVVPDIVVPACAALADDAGCDDGNACTTGDRCVAGVCRPLAFVGCDDHNPCTDDQCRPDLGCSHTNNLASCDDGDVCSHNDRCVAGTCRAGPATCDDGNPCTRDLCDGAGTCSNEPDDSLFCEDGSACSADDYCADGVCMGGLADGCANLSASDPCSSAVCAADGVTCAVSFLSDVPCSDGDACTVGDRCVAGLCKSTGANTCGWDTECGAFHCDSVLGCVLDQVYDAGKTCSDNDKCTTGDICDGHGACLTSGVLDCDDHNTCTDDRCYDYLGCSHPSRSGPCDDNDKCTTGDYCSFGQCRGAGALTCADGDPCSVDSCDPLTGCEVAPKPCDDANACTDDSCDGVLGCVNSARAGPCDDGLACTIGDFCGGAICRAGAVACDDGDPCTIDVCDAEEGCVGDPICDALAGEGCDGTTCLAPASRLAIIGIASGPLRVTIANTSGASFRLGGFALKNGDGLAAMIGPDDLVVAPGQTLVGARAADVETVDADFVIEAATWAPAGATTLLAPGGAAVMTYGP